MSNYGPKITGQEYDHRVTSSASNPTLSEAQKSKEELNATIDHRLGVQFPQAKRGELFDLQNKMRKRHLPCLALGFVLNPSDPLAFVAKKNVQLFSQVLNNQDLQDFFDLSPTKLAEMLPPPTKKASKMT